MADRQGNISLVADTHPIIGEVIWIWGDQIKMADSKLGHRQFWVNDSKHLIINADEVPLSVHHGEWTGLMMPKYLAMMNCFPLDRYGA